MCNLYTKFVKFQEICKEFSEDLVTEAGNVRRPGPVPRFSDLEVIALSMAAEAEEIDSENWLFEAKLKECRFSIPNLISRRQFNDINYLNTSSRFTTIAAYSETRDISERKYSLTSSRRPTSSLNVPTDSIKRTGSRPSFLLQRQERGLKLCSHNLLTCSSSSGTMPRKPAVFLPE